MKKILLLFAAFSLAIVGNAQVMTYSSNDSNLDGIVDIRDVNHIISDIGGNGNSAPVISVDSICALVRTINPDVAKQVERKLIINNDPVTPTDDNLLPGKFSVSATKQVQFTKGNLYWDGSAFKFEENQSDYPKTWDETHVGHFYWTNLTDYRSGNAAYMPYAEDYNYGNLSTNDKLWCGEDNSLTVEGTDGLYALTGGENGEWNYLINGRKNACNLYKYDVVVTSDGTNYTNCLIIAPDNYTGELASSYTIGEVNAAGLVCLPCAGDRYGIYFHNDGGLYGYYWTDTPDPDRTENAFGMYFNPFYINPNEFYGIREYGCSLRLVRKL